MNEWMNESQCHVLFAKIGDIACFDQDMFTIYSPTISFADCATDGWQPIEFVLHHLFRFRTVAVVRQQPLPRRMPPLQFLRSQFDGSESETGATIQKSDPLRFAFRRRRTHGDVRLHATVAGVQTTILRMRSCEEKIFDYFDISFATASLFR